MLKHLCGLNSLRNDTYHEENQYLNLVDMILNDGKLQKGRNGNTMAIFGSSMVFSLEDNTIPILTTKKVAWKTCLKELLWFIKGSTNNQELIEQKVKIWTPNASREFLDSRGLNEREEGDLGPIYGFQWRHFNADYEDCHKDYSGEGIDQLQQVIDDLSNPETRMSRRIIMSAWNPCQLNQMALPPCHVLAQFSVIEDNKLSCLLYQRSGDVGLGVPFNIASYAFLTHLIASHCDLEASELVHTIGNTHIYDDHIEPMKLQTTRIPYKFPKLIIKEKKESINDYSIENFELKDYEYHESIKMDMRM